MIQSISPPNDPPEEAGGSRGARRDAGRALRFRPCKGRTRGTETPFLFTLSEEQIVFLRESGASLTRGVRGHGIRPVRPAGKNTQARVMNLAVGGYDLFSVDTQRSACQIRSPFHRPPQPSRLLQQCPGVQRNLPIAVKPSRRNVCEIECSGAEPPDPWAASAKLSKWSRGLSVRSARS